VLSCAYTCKVASSWLKGTDLSYGIYLWHMLFVTIFLANGFTQSGWLWPIVITCTLGAAALSWFGIERPALKFKSVSLSPNWSQLTASSAVISAAPERTAKSAD
jgi:peptidoglycan/LPS O-acetylase OafA/YrhL